MKTRTRLSIALLAAVATVSLALPAWVGASTKAATPVTVTMTEMKFAFSKKIVKRGAINFKLVNKGMIKHDLKIAGKTSKLIAPGKTGLLGVTIRKPGKYVAVCTLPGHAAAGMKFTLRVT